MWKRLKQRIDFWAIQAGAATLPEPRPRPGQRPEIEAILRDTKFLAPAQGPVVLQAEEQTNEIAPFHFVSQIATPFPENNTARGWILRSGPDWREKPLVLLVHGWNAELHFRHVLPRVARRLALQGMNAAAIELPFHSKRRPAMPAPIRNFISDDIPVMLHATRQSIADINVVLRWAKAQGCPSVGLWGFSLGAWLAGLHACVRRDQDALVLTTPVPDMREAIRTLLFCAPIRAALEGMEVDLSPLNLTSHQPLLQRSHILLHQADYDAFVSPEDYQALADSWKGIDRQRDPQSHITILVARRGTRSCVDWLGDKLRNVTGSPATRG